MRLQFNTTPLLIISALLSACSGAKELDIGDNVQEVGLELSDYAADWEGYAEAMVFTTEQGVADSDRVRLSIRNDGTGTLRVGDATFAAPTASSEPALDGMPGRLIGGVEYPISGARVEEQRLSFQFDALYAWSTWCDVQVSQATGNPNHPYSCLPDLVGSTGTGGGGTDCYITYDNAPNVPVSCGRLSMCQSNCQCTETECNLIDTLGGTVDAQLNSNGAELEGTLLVGELDRITLRMTK